MVLRSINATLHYTRLAASCCINILHSLLPFWYRLTKVVLKKRLLNGCSEVVVEVAVVTIK